MAKLDQSLELLRSRVNRLQEAYEIDAPDFLKLDIARLIVDAWKETKNAQVNVPNLF